MSLFCSLFVEYNLPKNPELWALRDGIQLCISLNLPAVIVELDAQLLVELLGKENDSSSSNNPILADCKG